MEIWKLKKLRKQLGLMFAVLAVAITFSFTVPVHADELHSLTVLMTCCSEKKRVRLVGDIFRGAMKTLCG